MPRNQGGSDDLSNLQALCFRCNGGKRDGCLPTQEVAPASVDCRPAIGGARRAVGSARWRPEAGCFWRTLSKLCIADADAVTPGHSLVIPRRHVADGLALHQPEWSAVVELPHPIVHKRTSTCRAAAWKSLLVDSRVRS